MTGWQAIFLDLDKVLHAYRMGLFPMAMHADSPNYQWVKPPMRGVIYMDKFHIPKSLIKFMKHSSYRFTKDKAFEAVIEACREVTKDRQESWINDEIKQMFIALYKAGHAHSYECWDTQDRLIGGLYGLDMHPVFCGESMFSRAENASKSCLVNLYEDLKSQNFTLIDTQFVNDHLLQFGAEEILDIDFIAYF